MSTNNQEHTPEPWTQDLDYVESERGIVARASAPGLYPERWQAHANAARIVACVNACTGINPEAVPDMLAALHEGRRAIGDHFAPNDCYATGPLTGNEYRDLVECPACSFIRMHDAAIAKAEGGAA
ncbi:MAG: hypothetical protein V4726_05820 [Verrucomicrobiota bacterium]